MNNCCHSLRCEIIYILIFSSLFSLFIFGISYGFLVGLYKLPLSIGLTISIVVSLATMILSIYLAFKNIREENIQEERIEFIENFCNHILMAIFMTLNIFVLLCMIAVVIFIIVFYTIKIKNKIVLSIVFTIESILLLYLTIRFSCVTLRDYYQYNEIQRRRIQNIISKFQRFEVNLGYSLLYTLTSIVCLGFLIAFVIIPLIFIMYIILALGKKEYYYEEKTTIICVVLIIVLEVAVFLLYKYHKRVQRINIEREQQPQQQIQNATNIQRERPYVRERVSHERLEVVNQIVLRRLHDMHLRNAENIINPVVTLNHQRRSAIPSSCTITSCTIKEETNCPICLSLIKTNAIKTYCEHTFCKDCLIEWLKTKNTCPCCRSELIFSNNV